MAGPHDHIAWFGDDLDDLYRLGVEALAAGARRGEKLLFIADAPDPARLSGLDELETLLADGRLEVLATDSVYPSGASFSAGAHLAYAWRGLIAYPGYRSKTAAWPPYH